MHLSPWFGSIILLNLVWFGIVTSQNCKNFDLWNQIQHSGTDLLRTQISQFISDLLLSKLSMYRKSWFLRLTSFVWWRSSFSFFKLYKWGHTVVEDVDSSQVRGKVMYPKYSKHWPYTVAHTIDCVYCKMLNHGLNHGLFLSLFKLIPCPIHWIVYVLAYLNFIFEF